MLFQEAQLLSPTSPSTASRWPLVWWVWALLLPIPTPASRCMPRATHAGRDKPVLWCMLSRRPAAPAADRCAGGVVSSVPAAVICLLWLLVVRAAWASCVHAAAARAAPAAPAGGCSAWTCTLLACAWRCRGRFGKVLCAGEVQGVGALAPNHWRPQQGCLGGIVCVLHLHACTHHTSWGRKNHSCAGTWRSRLPVCPHRFWPVVHGMHHGPLF
jgi:hypothetical protein